jgi:hypothetical protein
VKKFYRKEGVFLIESEGDTGSDQQPHLPIKRGNGTGKKCSWFWAVLMA